MRFFIDECCPQAIGHALAAQGHDVRGVSAEEIGAPDEEVLALARQESRILVTEDKDYGELLIAGKRPSHGVIVLRLGRVLPAERAERLVHLVRSLGGELVGCLTILRPTEVRTRRLPARPP
jgi:predicted nuclease of predicted toxin-antitoxin system